MSFKQYQKVDIHAHYIPQCYLDAMNECFGGNPDKFPQPTWSPEKHLAFKEELGIAFSLVSVSSPHMNFGTPEYNAVLARKCNDEGAELVRNHPDKFALIASLPLPDVEASLKEIAYCCDTLNVAGFTLPTNTRGTYITAPELECIFAELDKRGALVTFHPNKPTGIPEGVVSDTFPVPLMEFFFDTTRVVVGLVTKGYMTKYSNINYLLPHCGALLGYIADRLKSFRPVLISTGTVEEGFDVEKILAGLYYDLAGNTAAKQFPNMRQIADDSRYFYASDFPFTPLPVIISAGEDLFNAPYMDDVLKDKVAFKNAEGLLGKKLV